MVRKGRESRPRTGVQAKKSTTNHKIRTQTPPVLHPMTARPTTISRRHMHSTGAKPMSFAPRIEFPRGAHEWCIVLTPTAAITSGLRIQTAVKTCRSILENPRAPSPFHTTGITRGAKTRPTAHAHSHDLPSRQTIIDEPRLSVPLFPPVRRPPSAFHLPGCAISEP
jgi:hypothetical protein